MCSVGQQEEDVSALNEEISMNEATLESLSQKLLATEKEIALERSKIRSYESRREAIHSDEIQLQRARFQTTSLLKNVTASLNKCIRRMEDKMDGKVVSDGDLGHANIVNTHPIRKERHHSDEKMMCEKFIEEKHELTSATHPNISKRTDDEYLSSTKDTNTITTMLHPLNERKTGNNLMKVSKRSIQVNPITTNISQLKRFWSHIMKEYMYVIDDPIIQLHPPITNHEILAKIIGISQCEILKIRQQFERSSFKFGFQSLFHKISYVIWDELRNTSLDIFNHCQYDVSVLHAQKYHMQRKTKNKSTNGKNNCFREVLSPMKDSTREGRNDTEFLNNSEQYHSIDPNEIVCPYELQGTCADDSCPYQHLSLYNVNTEYFHVEGNNTPKRHDCATNLKETTIYSTKYPFNTELPPLNIIAQTVKNNENNLKDIRATEDSRLSNEDRVLEPLRTNKKMKYERKDNYSMDIKHIPEIKEPNIKSSCIISTKKLESNTQHSVMMRNCKKNSSSRSLEDTKMISPKTHATDPEEIENVTAFNNEYDNKYITSDDFMKLPLLPSRKEDDKGTRLEFEDLILSPEMWYCLEKNPEKYLKSKSPSIVEVLSLFGFDIESKTDDDRVHNLDIKYTASNTISCCFDEIKQETFNTNDTLKQLFSDLIFVAALTDALRLCIYAGRFDLCISLLELGNDFVCSLLVHKDFKKSNTPNEESHIIQEHDGMLSKVVADLQTILDRVLSGDFFSSFHNSFEIQLLLGIISLMLASYGEMLRPRNDLEERAAQLSNILNLNSIKDFHKLYSNFMKGVISKEQAEEEIENFNQPSDFYFPRVVLWRLSDTLSKTDLCIFERMKYLYDCISHGKSISARIAGWCFTHNSNQNNDPQEIIQQVLVSILENMRKFTRICKCSCEFLACSNIHSNFFTLCALSLFGIPIFSTISAFISKIKQGNQSEQMKKHINVNWVDPRSMGMMVLANRYYIQIIQQFDELPGMKSMHFGKPMLLAPFYCLSVTFLISLRSFTKSQLFIENSLTFLHPWNKDSEQKKNMWSIYSDVLWSQLVQLRLCFPTSTNEENPEFYSRLASNLTDYLFKYGINLSRIRLKGDSFLFKNCLCHFELSKDNKTLKSHSDLQYSFQDDSELAYAVLQSIYKPNIPQNGCNIEKRQLDSSGDFNGTMLKMHNSKKVIFGTNRPIGNIVNQRSLREFPRTFLLFGDALAEIQIVGCDLSSLPLTFGYSLRALQKINFSSNKLTCLPDSIGFIKNLNMLNVSNNHLHVLPETFDNLKYLTQLNISNNNITEVPSCLSGCQNLREIDLRANKIENIPRSLPLQLSKLSSLLLHGNPVCILSDISTNKGNIL